MLTPSNPLWLQKRFFFFLAAKRVSGRTGCLPILHHPRTEAPSGTPRHPEAPSAIQSHPKDITKWTPHLDVLVFVWHACVVLGAKCYIITVNDARIPRTWIHEQLVYLLEYQRKQSIGCTANAPQ